MTLSLDFDIKRNIGFLFNDRIFPIINRNIKLLQSVYSSDEKLCEIFSAIEERTFNNEDDLSLFLRNNIQYSDNDIDYILNDFNKRNEINKDSEQFILSKIEDILNEYLWNDINNRNDLTSTQKVDLLMRKSVSLAQQSILESTIQEGSLDELKVDHSFSKPVQSHCGVLNRASPVGGILNNTMIALAAAPGAGKSLFMMREAWALAKQGRDILYTALGDLDLKDFKLRLYAMVNNVSIDSAFIDTKKAEFVIDTQLRKLREMYGGSITIQIAPAGVMSIQDYDARLNQKGYRKSCNVFMLDYDQNVYSQLDSYEKGREIYNYFAALSDEGINICYVAGQLVKSSLNERIIGMEGLGDSRAKAEIADIVMTFSKDRNKSNTTGAISLPKVRRGKEGSSVLYFLDISGRYYELDKQSYDKILKMGESQITYCVEGGVFHQLKTYTLPEGTQDYLTPPDDYDIKQCRIMYQKELDKINEHIKFHATENEIYFERKLINNEYVIRQIVKPDNLIQYYDNEDIFDDNYTYIPIEKLKNYEYEVNKEIEDNYIDDSDYINNIKLLKEIENENKIINLNDNDFVVLQGNIKGDNMKIYNE